MARKIFFSLSIIALLCIAGLYPFWPGSLHLLIIVIPYILLGVYDLNSRHNVLRLYPVIGHFRYMFEFIRPEIQQYFVATNLSGRPFNREFRSMVYQRAKNAMDTHPFGTEHDINVNGYEFTQHSINVKKIPREYARTLVGGPDCRKPYLASRINISAMSFGALGKNAVMAMNLGAKLGNFAQNTGEGGLTKHHLKKGGDIFWQIGTGYFGCRTQDGKFDEKKFVEKANLDAVKMIEIKISQGAKPSHGGVLPAAKIDKEIAEMRGIPMGQDCLSPPDHSEFSSPEGLLYFVEKLRHLTGGKPTGFKICIGKKSEFMGICKAMLKTGITPDFITVDGAEGGTGAAPVEFTNRFGMPINEGLAFVHNCLTGIGVRDKIHIIASGKVVSGFDVVMKLSLGADLVNMARPMMFAVGCIQSIRCNTNSCPTGVATQDPTRNKALNVEKKSIHVKNFHHNTMEAFLEMAGAMGIDHPDKLSPHLVYYRLTEGDSIPFSEVFHYLKAGQLLKDATIHPSYIEAWNTSNAEAF
jgi:glutamate synthase domain-containing protein 2